jgi:polysaccharide pyruvyl transferase WcaK-like protein
MSKKKNILILAGDIDGNIGDRAIVCSMCQEFSRIHPSVDITLISENLETDRKPDNATLIKRGIRGLPTLISVAKKSDLILCGGGGLFQDDDSLIKMPYWALRLLFLRIFHKNITGYSLGVGPLRKNFSRFFAKLAFACMKQISVRDPKAMETAQHLTSKPIQITPDPALNLTGKSSNNIKQFLLSKNIPIDETTIVGVALRRWFHHKTTFIPHKYAAKYHLRKIKGIKKYNKMTTLLAQVLDNIIRQHNSFIVFLPTYNVPHEADYLTCKRVIQKMRYPRTALLIINDPIHYKEIAKYLKVMLGARMHPTIISASVGTDVVGLSYNQKFQGFFELLGIPEKVISIEDFVENEQSAKLTSLLSKAILNDGSLFDRVQIMSEKIRIFNEKIMASV